MRIVLSGNKVNDGIRSHSHEWSWNLCKSYFEQLVSSVCVCAKESAVLKVWKKETRTKWKMIIKFFFLFFSFFLQTFLWNAWIMLIENAN